MDLALLEDMLHRKNSSLITSEAVWTVALFARLTSVVKMVNDVVNGWTNCDTDVLFYKNVTLFSALHESDIWEVTEMEVGSHVDCNLDHGTNSHFVSTLGQSIPPLLGWPGYQGHRGGGQSSCRQGFLHRRRHQH